MSSLSGYNTGWSEWQKSLLRALIKVIQCHSDTAPAAKSDAHPFGNFVS
jgi:hypothetical protein